MQMFWYRRRQLSLDKTLNSHGNKKARKWSQKNGHNFETDYWACFIMGYLNLTRVYLFLLIHLCAVLKGNDPGIRMV